MKKAIDLETLSVTFSDDDGNVIETVTYQQLVDAGLEKQAALHGISQKIGDSYAGALKAVEGLDMTPETWSVERVKQSAEQIRNGDWNLRTGGGGLAVTDLAVALAEATGTSIEDAVAKLAEISDTEDKGKETKKQLRAHPAIAAILARIKRERAEKKEKELGSKADSGPDLSQLFG